MIRILNKFFEPIFSLPYGDKMVHAILGNLALFAYIFGADFYWVSVTAFLIGVFIEVVQRLFFDGTNTLEESVLDTLSTWIGGTAGALLLWQIL